MGVDLSAFTKSDFQKLIETAKEMNCMHIRLEGYGGTVEDLISGGTASNFQIIPVKKPYLPKYTIKLDLMRGEEKLLTEMKRKGRYNINIARKNDVQIEVFDGDDDSKNFNAALDAFYSILKETGERDEFGIHEKQYYKGLLTSLGSDARLYIAKLDDQIIAGIIVLYGETEAIYYYGASSNEHRNTMAPYLLQWHAIKEAKEAGKKLYDFMGVAEPKTQHQKSIDETLNQGMDAKSVEFNKADPLYGVSEFKQKFGGQLHKFNEPLDLVLKPLPYKMFHIAKRLLRK